MRRLTFCCLPLIVLACSAAFGKEKPQQPGPIHLDRDGEKWAEKTLHKLSPEEKVGQLFMAWVRAEFLNVDSPEYLQLRDQVQKYHVGSIAMTVRWEPPFLYRTQPYEVAVLLNRLQQDSTLPLLVAADFERGITMRLQGGTEFPHAMAFGAAGKVEYAEAFGRITAQEARAIGVNWNFFPDADVNSNPSNPIINTRSFGEDSTQVGDMVAAYIRAARANGMMTTAKHFPGHGDTATDSHLGLAQVTADNARLQAVELPPFREAIEAGVDSVMTAHVTVPSLDAQPNHVGSTSPAVVTGLLKDQLGFKGLVVTDALDMGGLTRLYAGHVGRAAVDAFKAGNDVLLKPVDLGASYKDVLEAVQSGEISSAQLDASVLKILKAKAALGLQKSRLVDVDAIDRLVGVPANVALGQQVADDAITLIRSNDKVLPLHRSGTIAAGLPYLTVEEVRNRLVVLILVDDVRSEAGRGLERQIKLRVPDANVIYADPRIAAAVSDDTLKAIDQAQSVVTAVYVTPTAGKLVQGPNGQSNSVSLSEPAGLLMHKILDEAAEKTIVVTMGSPYLATDFPGIQNYMCAFSSSGVSEVSAVRALFGEIPIHGRLPVTIPNVAQRGSGIDRPVARAQGGLHAHSQSSGQ